MAIWKIWHTEIPAALALIDWTEGFDTPEKVLAYFRQGYPSAHVEDFGDEILVWESEPESDEEDPIAGATYELEPGD